MADMMDYSHAMPAVAATTAVHATEALRVTALGKTVPLPEGALCILADVSFVIEAGDSVAIVGASGSGKSTLLSLLAGLDTPSTGDVSLHGALLSSLDEDGRARLRGERVGFVFQSYQLLRGDDDAESPARDILQQAGLGARLGHYPRQLSGGEQQRVAVARAFVTRPSLLFADEPTGNLDTQTGQAIIDLLFDLNARHGTTLVLVTHDEHLASRCRRTLRLESGRLVPA
jgi:putative ABC transport system ATP-binding protein